jgi:hypothetical protein
LIPFLAFPPELREINYTTNAMVILVCGMIKVVSCCFAW